MRRTATILTCLIVALLFASAPVWAAEAANKSVPAGTGKGKTVMETMNVTAKRVETEDVDTGSFTTVITPEDMERKGGFNAYDVLQRTEGLNFSSQLPGGVTQGGMNGEIGIRGISGSEQIMLNNIPIIEPTAGAYDIDQFPAAFLERIEVVKGSNSALYGSRAMTGVINMRTRRPGGDAVGGRFLGGSHTFFDGNAWYRNKYVFLGANYTRYDDLSEVKKNYSKTNPYNTTLQAPQKYSAMASVRPWQPLVLNYLFNYTDSGWEQDYWKKPINSYTVDEKVYHHYLSAEYEKSQFKATGFFNYNYMKTDYDYYGNVAKPGKNSEKKSFTTGLDVQNTTVLWNTMFLYGGTYVFEQQDETRQDVKGSSSKGYYVAETPLDHTRHMPSLFLQAEKTFWKQLILTLGIRGQGVLNTDEGSDDYYEPVPQFQAVFKLNQQNSLYGNVGRAFRVPTFNQMYSSTALFQGNPSLNPEYGWTYELGYKFELGAFSGTVAAFLMDYRDKIRYIYDGSDGRYYAQNMDKCRTTGVEWKLAMQVHDYVQLTFGGYGADPWQEEDGEREQVGPKWQMVPGVYFDNGILQLGLNATLELERQYNLDDYFNVHFTGSYKLTDWLKVRVKADNLLDQDLVANGNMTPDYSSRYEVINSGLWVYAGVEIELDLL